MIMSFRVTGPTGRRRFGRRNGNAMIETSLCFLLFMTIFLGIMEFGMGIFDYNFVSYAAREGARYAATHGSLSTPAATPADVADRIQAIIRKQAVGMDASQVTVATSWIPNNTPGNQVTVHVSYPITPLLGWLLGNMTVNAISTMRIAN
jgi:Flp pilus assembly protein TadG